jgi:hypothetical protein
MLVMTAQNLVLDGREIPHRLARMLRHLEIVLAAYRVRRLVPRWLATDGTVAGCSSKLQAPDGRSDAMVGFLGTGWGSRSTPIGLVSPFSTRARRVEARPSP